MPCHAADRSCNGRGALAAACLEAPSTSSTTEFRLPAGRCCGHWEGDEALEVLPARLQAAAVGARNLPGEVLDAHAASPEVQRDGLALAQHGPQGLRDDRALVLFEIPQKAIEQLVQGHESVAVDVGLDKDLVQDADDEVVAHLIQVHGCRYPGVEVDAFLLVTTQVCEDLAQRVIAEAYLAESAAKVGLREPAVGVRVERVEEPAGLHEPHAPHACCEDVPGQLLQRVALRVALEPHGRHSELAGHFARAGRVPGEPPVRQALRHGGAGLVVLLEHHAAEAPGIFGALPPSRRVVVELPCQELHHGHARHVKVGLGARLAGVHLGRVVPLVADLEIGAGHPILFELRALAPIADDDVRGAGLVLRLLRRDKDVVRLDVVMQHLHPVAIGESSQHLLHDACAATVCNLALVPLDVVVEIAAPRKLRHDVDGLAHVDTEGSHDIGVRQLPGELELIDVATQFPLLSEALHHNLAASVLLHGLEALAEVAAAQALALGVDVPHVPAGLPVLDQHLLLGAQRADPQQQPPEATRELHLVQVPVAVPVVFPEGSDQVALLWHGETVVAAHLLHQRGELRQRERPQVAEGPELGRRELLQQVGVHDDGLHHVHAARGHAQAHGEAPRRRVARVPRGGLALNLRAAGPHGAGERHRQQR
mmetsp:Transcript_95446/g.308031  ORF Transcript_95446/g.308031 Transcript_95446/m.308031 type:complete len:653 (+) Transcript_95446:124-2082(+)